MTATGTKCAFATTAPTTAAGRLDKKPVSYDRNRPMITLLKLRECSFQISPGKGKPCNLRIYASCSEPATSNNCSVCEIGIVEIRIREVDILKDRPREICTTQVCAIEINVLQNHAGKVRTGYHGTSQVAIIKKYISEVQSKLFKVSSMVKVPTLSIAKRIYALLKIKLCHGQYTTLSEIPRRSISFLGSGFIPSRSRQQRARWMKGRPWDSGHSGLRRVASL